MTHDEAARWLVMRHAPVGRPAHAVVVNLADITQDVPVGDATGAVLLAWDDVGTEPRDHAVRVPAASVAVVRER